jgi:hypothetical protein
MSFSTRRWTVECIPPWAVYIVVVVSLALVGWARESAVRAPLRAPAPRVDVPPVAPKRTLYDDADLLEIAITSSDAVVQNLDAVNLAALALCALPVALLVVIADKIRALPPPVGTSILVLNALSVLFGYLGYEWGYHFSVQRVLDSLDTTSYVAGYMRFGDVAVNEAIAGVNRVADEHRALRRQKRRCISFGMGFFALTIVVLVGWRVFGPVDGPTKDSPFALGKTAWAQLAKGGRVEPWRTSKSPTN